MPSELDLKYEQRFVTTGVCACGEHIDKHARSGSIEDLQTCDINCKLSRMEVPAWNAVRRPQPQGQ